MVETRIEDVPTLREEFVWPHTVVFKAIGEILNAKRHLRRLSGDVQVFEKLNEVRIRGVVKNNKPCVDGDHLPVFLDEHRVGVTAGAGFAFDERDIRLLA